MAHVFIVPHPQWSRVQGESATSSGLSPVLLSNKNQRGFRLLTGTVTVTITESTSFPVYAMY
jgi:hypothetical protein